MTKSEIELLEREVAEARLRVSASVAELTAPGGLAELKSEALGSKDELVDHARSVVSGTINGAVENVKARIAANPVAALAIGAGVAWRLTRHPPIATALLGYGLYSLFRTDPDAPTAASTYLDRAAGAAVAARRRAGDAVQVAVETGAAARAAAGEFAAETGAVAKDATEKTVATAEEWTESGREMLDRAIHHEDRDKVLLGAAALALAAAVGIAWHRHASAEEDEE